MSRRLLAYLLLIVPAAFAAEPQKLTLPDAVRMALAQNRSLKIARLKVAENEQKKAANRADYFPELKNQSMIAHTTAVEDIGIPAGAFGTIPGGGLSPDRNVLITQGNQTFFTSGTSLTQPLTPLIRIHAANRIAAAETAASRDDLKAAENEVALQVHQVYYNILTTRLRKLAAEQESAYSETRLSESQQDIRNGNALKVAAIEGRAGLLQSLQDSLTLDLQLSDLNYELNDLLALPLDTRLELSPVEPVALPGPSREEALSAALAENPQIAAAQEKVEQAKAGVAAAKSAYIPDVSVFARQSYQSGVPFLVHNFGTFGASLNYDLFDFGKRRAVVREREAELAQAEQNVEKLKDSMSVQIERSLNKVERTEQMLQVAAEVVKLRAEGERVTQNQLTEGVVLVSARRQASAASYKAQADLLQAQLAHLFAQAELEQTIGRTPGQ
ncbi:MAG: TolC family protein [Bryobacteraceae bacterium]